MILLSVPTLLQLLASVFAYTIGDAPAGTAFGVLGASWLAQGLVLSGLAACGVLVFEFADQSG